MLRTILYEGNHLLEKIVSDRNIKNAMDYVISKGGGCGFDEIRVKDLEEYWRINGKTIIDYIKMGQYQPSEVLVVNKYKPNTQKRKISIYSNVDKMLLKAIGNVIEPLWENDFSSSSYAYQKNKGVADAVGAAARYITQGYSWVLEIDILNFFDSINLTLMEKKIAEKINDERVIKLISSFFRCYYISDFIFTNRTKGLFQGSPLSPFFSNVYMMDFDKFLEKKYHFCRYSDNINVYFKTREQALAAYREIEIYLYKYCKLEINKAKSGVYPAEERSFLGYRFYNRMLSNMYEAKKTQPNSVIKKTWNKSNIAQVGRDYHLINEGILTKRDYTILFDNIRGKRYLPAETSGVLSVYSDVVFDRNFFEFANSKGLIISICDKHGNNVGKFIPNKRTPSAEVSMKQMALYTDDSKRMKMAMKLEEAYIHNIRENLRYYYRRNKTDSLEEGISKLSKGMKFIKDARNINVLLLNEARMRQEYYSYWNYIINNQDFAFKKRSKRPPLDCINALISFGNTFLYNLIAAEIYKTTLDIRISFCHSANNRSESLNLDIADIFKPVIVDKVIFSLINKKEIDAKIHFVKNCDGSVYLSKDGKRLFINALYDKLHQKLSIKGDEVSYLSLIKEEIHKIRKMIIEDEDYKPYKYY